MRSNNMIQEFNLLHDIANLILSFLNNLRLGLSDRLPHFPACYQVKVTAALALGLAIANKS